MNDEILGVSLLQFSKGCHPCRVLKGWIIWTYMIMIQVSIIT